MSVYCVTEIQLTDQGEVKAAVLRAVNPANPQEFGQAIWLEAHQVVSLIMGGDTVQSTFPVQGHRVLGPVFKRKVLAGGVETIELADDIEGRTLLNMSVATDRI